jgi:hypothetical protein
MCMKCEQQALAQIEEGMKLLRHDVSALHPVLREQIEQDDANEEELSNFFLQAAIARLACALALRSHKPPFIVLGEIAGSMMEAQAETEEIQNFINMTGLSPN